MCGPSPAEQSIQGQEEGFANVLQSNYQTQFANQSGVLSQINSALTPIVAAGPGQAGYTAPELAAKQSQILDTTAANYQNAAKAVNSEIAGKGGDSGLESGVSQQLQETTASKAAQQQSTAEENLTAQDYATGRQQYNEALSGEQALASAYNPQSYGSLTTNATGQAFGEANQIQQQKNQEQADIAGAITGGVTSVFGGGGIASGVESLFGGNGGNGGAYNPGGSNTPGGYQDDE